MKRKPRLEDDCAWDCSVCTFTNSKDAFACQMCDTRKGTSTRKPRINNQVVELQQQIQKAILKEKTEDVKKKATPHTRREDSFDEPKSNKLPKLKNIDRNKPSRFEITSGGITVTITEFKVKHRTKVVSMSSTKQSYDTPSSHPSNDCYDATSPISPSVSSCSSSFQANLTSTPFNNEFPGNLSTTQLSSLPPDSLMMTDSLTDQGGDESKRPPAAPPLDTDDSLSHTRSTTNMSDCSSIKVKPDDCEAAVV